METQPAKQTIISSEDENSDAAFYLVSRLLIETLAANHEVVVVKANPGKFLHDPQMRFELSGPASVHITDAELTELGKKTEISITGVVEINRTIHCSYTLYFLLQRDMPVIPLKTTHLEKIIGRVLVYHLQKTSDSLHDSIFELSLNRINIHGVEYSLGKGRGFLVFNMNEPEIIN